jgi:hypothetical protein
MVFWCGLVPVAGAFVIRRNWRVFRRRFDDLRLRPVLDYAAYCRFASEGSAVFGENVFRFLGGMESLTDGHTLWIRSDTLTIPVSLSGALTYILPVSEKTEEPGLFDPGEEAPQRIRWNQVTTFTEGAKVFVGGILTRQDNRWSFVSTREYPLLVIFYDGPAHTLANRIIRAGRHRNEYFNPITPYAYMFNAFSQVLIAFSFLSRPAFRLTVLTAVIAIFAPLFALLPPGVLLTALYRRLWWRAKIFRAYRDLVMLPLKYLNNGDRYPPPEPGLFESRAGQLPDGEVYTLVYTDTLPAPGKEGPIPLLIPEHYARKGEGWTVFGALPKSVKRPGSTVPANSGALPVFPAKPGDPFGTYGALPGHPDILAQRFNLAAYALEILGGLLLLVGISLNILFIGLIVYLLQ